MTIFEPDFIFGYPCFVSDIFDPRFLGYKKSYKIPCIVHRTNTKKVFDFDNLMLMKV